jgi:hypothetical protein
MAEELQWVELPAGTHRATTADGTEICITDHEGLCQATMTVKVEKRFACEGIDEAKRRAAWLAVHYDLKNRAKRHGLDY